MEITIQELKALDESKYQIIDITWCYKRGSEYSAG